ncbi:zinc-ribbon domain-containing protein [Leifsonia soli]|uniref:Protein-arginine kinase activator protein McsA/DNA-directed RNA polymerase subunit RPC12/RpoP n=1 Tax=Leifsonia soli TaxID=582665 RepID=A0A852T6D6_9MICO|nr:zinc-ribbon domain-containing protein [Leifsonia soli]NYD76020.1 protein-arginine kinase activator protein McsA/DNA-directed RNA polymerase subunit RPC12/RpoP [Leifsonia soli]
MLPDSPNSINRPLPFTPRLRHHETFDSYSARYLAANFLDAAHQRQMMRWARPAYPDLKPHALWRRIVCEKTRIDEALFQYNPRELQHPDGTSCAGCRVGTGDQWMCRLCSAGETVELQPHLDNLVCTRHRIWVGSGATPEIQHVVGDDFVAAERIFQKLRRKGVVDATTLWELVHVVDPSLADEAEHHLMPAKPFPDAMRIWGLIASTSFAIRFFNPCQTYQSAHEYLAQQLERVGLGDVELVNRVWHYLRPTALAVREWVLGAGQLQTYWQHDFHLDPAVVHHWKSPARPLEPFSRYLAASGVTEITNDNWREVLTHRSAGHSELFMLGGRKQGTPGICVNGHRTSVLAVARLSARSSYRCAYCDGRRVVPGENDITMTHPLRATYFDAEANPGTAVTDLTSTLKTRMGWKCPLGHKYVRSVTVQCRAVEPCVVCDDRVLAPERNSIAALVPQVIAEWDHERNELSPWEMRANDSRAKAWFICQECGHRYETFLRRRLAGSGCLMCAREDFYRFKTAPDIKLIDVRPDLGTEWDPELNDGLQFKDLLRSHRIKRRWRCPNGHITVKTPAARENNGCGACWNAGIDYFGRYPVIMSEYDIEANGAGRVPRSAVWWTCKAAGHQTQRSVHGRRQSRGCVLCPKEKRIAAGLGDGTF